MSSISTSLRYACTLTISGGTLTVTGSTGNITPVLTSTGLVTCTLANGGLPLAEAICKVTCYGDGGADVFVANPDKDSTATAWVLNVSDLGATPAAANPDGMMIEITRLLGA